MTLSPAPTPNAEAPALAGEVAPQLALQERLVAATNSQEVAAVVIEAGKAGLTAEQLGEAFIARAVALAQNAPERELSALLPAHRGIFGPQSSCRASMFAEPVHFDDPALFGSEILVQALSKFQGPDTAPEILRGALPNVALWAQALYFNSFRSEEAVSQERQHWLGGHDGDVSLSELRGKRFTACAERAPTTANVLAVLGLDVLTVCGECNLNGTPEMHVYNILAGRDKFYIVDPTNPVVWRYEDGRRTFSLGAYPIPAEQLADFASGGVVSVTHRDMQETSEGKFDTGRESRRVYQGPKGQAELCRAFFRLDR